MPEGRELEAVAFYNGVLGIPRAPKPPNLAARGGVWFERGDLRIHLGVEADFRPARKAHPALIADDLSRLRKRLEGAGIEVVVDEPLVGFDRFYVNDPFGNRIEFLAPLST